MKGAERGFFLGGLVLAIAAVVVMAASIIAIDPDLIADFKQCLHDPENWLAVGVIALLGGALIAFIAWVSWVSSVEEPGDAGRQ